MKMPFKKAEAINLSDQQVSILEELERKRTGLLYLSRRSKIILMASQGESNGKISGELGITMNQVRHWRNKYTAAYEHLLYIENNEPANLKQVICELLKDESRSGKNPTFTAEQKALIIALACQNPIDLGLPFTHWTHESLTKEVIRAGIVTTVSKTQIGRLLKSAGIKTSLNSDLD